MPFSALSEALLEELATEVTHEKFEASGVGLHAQRLPERKCEFSALPARRSGVRAPD